MTTEDRIRVTHREREAAVEELRTAYAVGCLDDDELEDRISRAYGAKVRGELAALVGDLPAVPAPGSPESGRGAQPAPAGWLGRVHRVLGLACWLMLAAAGAWLIAVAAGGVAAVPLIFLWLALLQLRGWLPRWYRQLAAAVLISRYSSLANGSVAEEKQP
jgi:hypothetical protein